MSKSRIEYCDRTLNIITGCKYGCPYCYAETATKRFSGNVKRHLNQRDQYRVENGMYVLDEPFYGDNHKQVIYPFGFQPTFHRYMMHSLDKLKGGHNILVGAMSDTFGEWVPDEWIEQILSECMKHKKHNYLFLTRNAERYSKISLPASEQYFYGISVTKKDEMYKLQFLPEERNTYVCFDPILEDVRPEEYSHMLKKLDWIIIGAETGGRKEKVEPKADWVKKVVREAETLNIPIFMKSNIKDIVGETVFRQEYPARLLVREESDRRKEMTTSNCLLCKDLQKNSEMVNFSVRVKHHGTTRSLGYVCKPCFYAFCKENGITVPQLEGLARESEDTEL